MQSSLLKSTFTLAVICCFAGCGSEFPPVSGTVTFDGKPLSKVKVVFSPVAKGNSAIAGPYSSGVTDEKGIYQLTTRDGESGAVVGDHKVGFQWSDISPGTLPALYLSLSETDTGQKNPEILKRIEEVKAKLRSRPKLEDNLQVRFSVVEGGTDKADFELTNLSRQ